VDAPAINPEKRETSGSFHDGSSPDPRADRPPSADLLVAGALIAGVEAGARLLLSGPFKDAWAVDSPVLRESGPFLLTAALRSLQAGLALGWVLAVRRRGWGALALGRAGALRAAAWGAGLACAGAAGLGAWALARALVPALPGFGETLGGASPTAPFAATALVAVPAMVLAGPIAEEIFFRGVLFRVLRRPAGFLPALLASSLLFAAAHAGGPCVWPWYLAGGLVFGILMEKTGSLWGPVAAHAAGNAVLWVAWAWKF
jgi:hypothetical protein